MNLNFISTLKDRLKILSDIFTKLLQFKTVSVKTIPTIKTGPTQETEQVTIENFCPKIIPLNQNNLKNFEPGIVFDTNVLIHFEDFPDLFKVGKKINEGFINKRIYIVSQIKKEFSNKRCPENYKELVNDGKYTGRKRDFNHILNELPKALGVDIYFVNITKSEKIMNKAQEYLPDLEEFGLHDADSIFLAFAKLTKSTLVTCDKELLRCCSLAQCQFIEFQGFLEKVCQPSPITKMLRDRRNHRRNQYKKLRKYQHHSRWGI